MPYDLVRPLYELTSFHRSVIEEVEDDELRSAYIRCRGITRDYAKTFYLATRFLPNQKQRSIFALYGFCRYVDTLVDEAQDLVNLEALDLRQIEVSLERVKEQLQDVYSGRTVKDPILKAFGNVLTVADIPIQLPLDLIDGVMMDLEKKRYATFEEVYEYSYKVASVVGLMTSEVFGYTDPEARKHAIDLGIAMQLTNILRDIGEDLERDRIYLPADELAEFGVTENDLAEHRQTPEFDAFMMFQIDRARSYYDSARKGIPMLSRDSRLPVYLALENYSRILNKIERNRFDVFSRRAHLNQAEKIGMLPRVIYRLKMEK